MNVLENDEGSLVGTGANGRLFNDQRSWPTTPDPSPIPQYPSSTPQDDRTYKKLLRDYTHYPSDYYHYHVRPLAVDSHVYLTLLTHYSYLPMASRMSLNFVTRTLVPRTLQQDFLM